MRRIAGSPFSWLAVMLILLEVTAWRVLPYGRTPRADEVIRNQVFHRGWPEYIDVEYGDEAPVVVLITNSQGVAPEIADSSEIAPAYVRRGLETREPPAHLENWACSGIRASEMELLSMKAVERGVDLVVFSVAATNFEPLPQMNLDFPFSDIPLLAGDPAIWRWLPDAAFAGSLTTEGMVRRFVQLHSHLARSRFAVLDLAAEQMSMRWHRWVLGKLRRPRQRLASAASDEGSIFWIDQRAALVELKEAGKRRGPQRGLSDSGRRERLKSFRAFLPRLRERLAGTGTRVLWIWCPVNTGVINRASLANVQRFIDEAGEILDDSSIPVHDLHLSVEAERFLTPGHFDDTAHEAYGRRLLEVIGEELGR